jgi:hypothetical protein
LNIPAQEPTDHRRLPTPKTQNRDGSAMRHEPTASKPSPLTELIA